MKTGFRAITLLFFSLAACSIVHAQAIPAATQLLQISAFGAATGTWTGLNASRNIGITAGVDIGWKPFYRFYPSVEARGTYPIDDGKVDAQKNVLYGFKAERYYGRLHPYGDFLVGRDKIIYQNGGYPNSADTLVYLDSVSNVFSYGGGFDLTLTDHFALKVDGQFQHYGVPVPVNSTGHIWSKPLSVGVVYRFDFNHHIHYDRNGQVKGYKPPPEPKSPPPPPPPASDNPAPGGSSASQSQ